MISRTGGLLVASCATSQPQHDVVHSTLHNNSRIRLSDEMFTGIATCVHTLLGCGYVNKVHFVPPTQWNPLSTGIECLQLAALAHSASSLSGMCQSCNVAIHNYYNIYIECLYCDPFCQASVECITYT